MANVYFSTREYELNHGRTPRGFGSWAFVAADKSHGDYLPHVKWFNQMTYGDAKKQARAAFAAEGVSDVVVCS